jgi:hypothetical protein
MSCQDLNYPHVYVLEGFYPHVYVLEGFYPHVYVLEGFYPHVGISGFSDYVVEG